MNELRRVVQKKYTNKSLRSPEARESRVPADITNSENSNDNSQVQEFFNNQIASRDKQGSLRGTGDKEKHKIEWDKEILFYEDSEGDFNVISEDEDIDDAIKYITQRSKKALECTIVKREMYDKMRHEQMGDKLNQSKTWMESDQN